MSKAKSETYEKVPYELPPRGAFSEGASVTGLEPLEKVNVKLPSADAYLKNSKGGPVSALY